MSVESFLDSIENETLRQSLIRQLQRYLGASRLDHLTRSQQKRLDIVMDFIKAPVFDLQSLMDSHTKVWKRWRDTALTDNMSYGIRFSKTHPKMLTLGVMHHDEIRHIRCLCHENGRFQLYGRGKKMSWYNMLRTLAKCMQGELSDLTPLNFADWNYSKCG